MKNFDINSLCRKNILNLTPYSSARSEYEGSAQIFLDANENSLGSAVEGSNYNRYPDPLQKKLKQKISELKNVPAANIFLGNGSDEPIDLLFRAFCEPGLDNIITTPPTYGMYEVSANINHVAIKEVPLDENFQLKENDILSAVDKNTKIIFICSPNNPSANLMKKESVENILNTFNGIVVIDEAYIEFADESWTQRLAEFPNLVVLQTFSKAWGMAALRLGMAFTSAAMIEILNKIKPPYNINQSTQELALKALDKKETVHEWISIIRAERKKLEQELPDIACIEKIYPSDANFILAKVSDAKKIYEYLKQLGIIVRNRSSLPGCDNCIRITVGTPAENTTLINALKKFAD